MTNSELDRTQVSEREFLFSYKPHSFPKVDQQFPWKFPECSVTEKIIWRQMCCTDSIGLHVTLVPSCVLTDFLYLGSRQGAQELQREWRPQFYVSECVESFFLSSHFYLTLSSKLLSWLSSLRYFDSWDFFYPLPKWNIDSHLGTPNPSPVELALYLIQLVNRQD